MQQDNNLKNKLQQLDNQQLPDLSQMDKHWKEMQAGLVSAETTIGKRFPVKGFWLIAGICIIGLALLIHHHFSHKEIFVPTAMFEEKTITEEQKPLTDTTILHKTNGPANRVANSKKVKPVSTNNGYSKSTMQQPLTKKQSINDVAPDLLKTDEPVINKVQLLQDLLNQLKKPATDFVINNSKDTLLDCPEGASLIIHANSLGGGEITVSITEFYKKSDIILNRLSTTSDTNLLESGGMLHIEASKNGIPVQHALKIPIKFYVADTGANMQTMQLFTGEEKQPVAHANQNIDIAATTISINGVNWIAQPQYFRNNYMVTEVKVLDLRNEPYKTIKRKRGVVGVFNMASNAQLSKPELKKMLKEKYGYYKVRFGYGQNSFFHGRLSSKIDTLTYSDAPIGDSAWVNKLIADKYHLAYSSTRTYQVINIASDGNSGIRKLMSKTNGSLLEKIKDRYSVDINSLGWINCDRFNYDTRQKTNYIVDLGDSASNYYTIMVFNKIKSMSTGMISGNKVIFMNMPVGEPVKIISLGIGKNGQTQMAMKETNIETTELTGLKFETNTVASIRSSLSTMDK